MPHLNYHHLRYFWLIATEGSMSRAARRLNVSPSSLSVQLKALEDQLGQKLFERLGRALQLTEAGRIALDYAGRVFKSSPSPRLAANFGTVTCVSEIRNFGPFGVGGQ